MQTRVGKSSRPVLFEQGKETIIARTQPLRPSELKDVLMTATKAMSSSTAGSNHVYANTMRSQLLMDEDRIWLPTYVIYEYLVYKKPGQDKTIKQFEIGPETSNIVPVIAALLNHVTRDIWSSRYPEASALTQYVRAFELARAMDDIMLDSTGDIPLSDEERDSAIMAAHSLMSYADDWLEPEIGWRPFSKFHMTDAMLKDVAQTHMLEMDRELDNKSVPKQHKLHKIEELRNSTFKNLGSHK